jgi:hypothetical protein
MVGSEATVLEIVRMPMSASLLLTAVTQDSTLDPDTFRAWATCVGKVVIGVAFGALLVAT